MDEQTPQEPAVPRVIDRLRAAGLSEERIRLHLESRVIRLDGELVTDLEQPAPRSTRPVLGGT